MTLSILCVTDGKLHAFYFLNEMSLLAKRLECEFIVGDDQFKKPNEQDVDEAFQRNVGRAVHGIAEYGN